MAMLSHVAKLIVVAVIVAIPLSAVRADDIQPQAEILHWWVSEGESAALSVFIDEFKSRGGYYYDSSKNNEVASREEAIERMGKGYPATLTQWNAGNDLLELFDYGLIKSINKREIVQRLKDTLPEPVLDTVSHDGKIIAIPLNIHSENWMWYSKKHLGQQDIKLSGNWAEFLQLGATLGNSGIPLLAVGNQSWQVRILFTSVFLGVSRDRYRDFYISSDPKVAQSAELKTTLEVFNKLASYSHSFGDSNWDTQVKAVAENRAATNFMGDWARGEFMSLGKKVGKDFGCQLTSTQDPSLLMVIDALVLGKVDEHSEIAGQELMLDVITDADISLEFNALKGSVSPYARPHSSQLDHCARQVYAALGDDNAIIPPYHSYFPNGDSTAELIDNAIFDFWNASLQPDHDPSELIERTLDRFRSALSKNRAGTTLTATSED